MPPICHQTRCHPEPDAYICEARIRDRHVTFNYCKKPAELATFLLFSKCRRGFLLRGFRDSSASCNSRSAWFQNSSSLPVALFPEFVSTLSDLIFCWLIHCALPPSTACPSPGGLVGEKVRGCAG